MTAPRAAAILPPESPFRPDPVLPPSLSFGGELALALTYPAHDEAGHVRVTFEGLDSFRWARGEYAPYDSDREVAVVEPSEWLAERHAYEAEFYGDSYEWGRGADTMLSDTRHYLFVFHDEFVEVLARGLWFERAADPWAPEAPLTPGHPANALTAETRVEHGEHDGVRFELRANPRSAAELVADGRLHSQPVFELLLDDASRPAAQRVRSRTGHDGRNVHAWVEGALGVESATFDHMPTRDEVMPLLRAYMSEVAERRR